MFPPTPSEMSPVAPPSCIWFRFSDQGHDYAKAFRPPFAAPSDQVFDQPIATATPAQAYRYRYDQN